MAGKGGGWVTGSEDGRVVGLTGRQGWRGDRDGGETGWLGDWETGWLGDRVVGRQGG